MSSDFSAIAATYAVNPRRRSGGYPEAFKATLSHAAGEEAISQISTWPGYAETPLVSLDKLAATTGLAAIHYKQEAGRFGLGSFKALGGAYAVFRLLVAEVEKRTGRTPTAADLTVGTYADITARVTVTCATDGNHGRSVAWGAGTFGCKAVIFIHKTVSVGREREIARYGAEVVRFDGNYDDSVREAARQAAANGWFVVSDTSYPGYVETPKTVMQGYSVMAAEALRQMGGARPTHVFLQGGVGALPAAVTAHLWETYGADMPTVVVVEPETAACLLASAKAGVPTAVHGELDTIMAGLACGEPSLLAWPILDGAVKLFMAIPDEAAAATMRLLASGSAGAKLIAGESGVAGLAGLLVAASHPDIRSALGLGASSSVLLIGSEGDTDPELYREITGLTAAEVEALR